MSNSDRSNEAVAIIGMAGRFPQAPDVPTFWANITSGSDSIERRISDDSASAPRGGRFVPAIGRVAGVETFDADYFRVPPSEAILIDPQHRLLLEVAEEALQISGYANSQELQIGAFVGCGANKYRASPPSSSPDYARSVLAGEKDFVSLRLAHKLDLRGPVVTVQASCATGLTAVALACSSLIARDCDIAIAGAASLALPHEFGYWYEPGGILSADGYCRAFDSHASGTVPGSAVVVVVLKRNADAIADRDTRQALVTGWASNNDGAARAGFTAPSSQGQEAVIRAAHRRAGVRPDDVGYIETHGTGTPLGDPIELSALKTIFDAADGAPACLIGTTKPNVGHADAASGLVGMVKASMVVKSGIIPPSLYFHSLNTELDLSGSRLAVAKQTREWGDDKRVAGVSSFGMGGANAHVLLSNVPTQALEPSARDRFIFTLSARSDCALTAYVDKLTQWLLGAGRIREEWADIAYSLSVGRRSLPYRWAVSIDKDESDLHAAIDRAQRSTIGTGRLTLGIHGSPQQVALAIENEISRHPFLASAAQTAQIDGSISVGGCIVALENIIRAFEQLGLQFSNIETPAWAEPWRAWRLNAQRRSGEAIPSSFLDGRYQSGDDGVRRLAQGHLMISTDFCLVDAIRDAWLAGAAVAWHNYYDGECRSRIPTPTYPFQQNRYWSPNLPGGSSVAADSDAGATYADSELKELVRRTWSDVLGHDLILDDADFAEDLSGDSIYAVEISARLSDELGLDLPLNLPYEYPTVAATTSYIEAVVAQQ